MVNNGFEETVNELKAMVRSPQMYREFHSGYTDYSQRTIDAMASNIQTAQETDESNVFEVNEQLLKDVIAVLHDTQNMLVLSANNDFKIRFFKLYSLLAANWNKLANNKVIADSVKAIALLSETHKSLETLLTMTRLMSDKYEKLLNRNPHIFKVSSHYLESIKKTLDKHKD